MILKQLREKIESKPCNQKQQLKPKCIQPLARKKTVNEKSTSQRQPKSA